MIYPEVIRGVVVKAFVQWLAALAAVAVFAYVGTLGLAQAGHYELHQVVCAAPGVH